MKTLKKKIKAQATAAKANLDAAILGLRNASLEQLMDKLEDTKARLEKDRDLAWNIATGVLAKVKAVRESMNASAATEVKAKKRQISKKAKSAMRKTKTLVVKTRIKSKAVAKKIKLATGKKTKKSQVKKSTSRRARLSRSARA
ncbi:MAG: hypothetical protein AB7N80_07175 [Bdellovibrionales bacterium]